MSKKLAGNKLVVVRESGVHGNGVFAKRDIPKGTKIIEYTGEKISWKEAVKRHPHDPSQPNHTFYFGLEDGSTIDAKYGGNAAMWANHSCKPNCEALEEDFGKTTRVFLYAKKDIAVGDELFYDYGLVVEGKQTKKLKKEYECRCGQKNCRKTMLAKNN
jgi:SET domain-containing protein